MNRQASTIEDVLSAMAYDRETFKDKVEEKVAGALLEHYKAALAGLNRQTRWAAHWEGEVNRLLSIELVVTLLHSIKGFRDRKKAAHEVLQHLRSIDTQYRRAAEHIVKRDYGVKRLSARITDELTDQFYARAGDIIETHARPR